MVKTAPPPPPPSAAPPAAKQQAKTSFTVSKGILRNRPQIIVVYGPGGIGKSTLVRLAQDFGRRPLTIDLEHGSGHIDIDRVEVDSWSDTLGVLRADDLWSDRDLVVVDSLTRGEELDIAWTLENVPHEKGHTVKSIEGYGFGKGFTHVYETFLQLLAELDRHVRAGRSVLCIAHDCTASVPNPAGDDYIRYEPRLQSPSSGKASIRHRVREWCDHLLFVGYDIDAKDGKARGSGTRTIYPVEMPTHMAKSRTLSQPIPYNLGDTAIWQQIFSA